jgi:pimeloyl-ACP methyl ester carboxylesterase
VGARGLTFDTRIGGPPDGDPVLLLHGFPQNSRQWVAAERRLHAAGLRTIAPDQRGYSPGARPAEVAAYHVNECADDVPALLDALELPSAHVVGHDWGALAAWFAAIRHPDRVRTLTAVSVPHPAAAAEALGDDVEQKARSAYVLLFRQKGISEAALGALGGKGLKAMFRGSGLTDAEIGEYVVPMLEPGALTAALNWYRAFDIADFAAAPPVAVPVTYVWSDGDAAIGRAAAEACAKYVTGPYEFAEFTGVSHWIPDEAPEQLAEAILRRIR